MLKLPRNAVRIAVAAVIIGGGSFAAYAYFRKPALPMRYVLGTVTKGTLVAAVSGTGQVSVTDKVELKPKASGDLTYLNAKVGQQVKAGTVIGRVDSADAVKSVRDAEDALETAKLSLQKLVAPLDDLAVLQAENALVSAKKSKADAVESLDRAYDDGFSDVADAFLDLPAVMTGLESVLHGSDMNGSTWNTDAYADAVKDFSPMASTYRDDVERKYRVARTAYDENFAVYRATSRDSANASISALVRQTGDTAELLSDTLKSADNLIRYYQDRTTGRGITPKQLSDTHLSKLAGYSSTVNAVLAEMEADVRAVDSAADAIDSAERDLVEREISNEQLAEPPDQLDLRSAELAVRSREASLAAARRNLGDYVITAPFDGTIAAVGAKRGESVSASTAVATLITETKTVEVSLNEIDAAMVAVGQKATLTFDAVEDLSLSGRVASVDTLGSVSQGVVTYGVIIALDADDERVKPGMTASANIITDVRTDALLVPTSAVRTMGDFVTVSVPAVAVPEDAGGAQGVEIAEGVTVVQIEVGISDGVSTEVRSGLAEGDAVVIRTIDPNAATAANNRSTSALPGLGGSTRAQGAASFRSGGTGGAAAGNAVFISR